jgi:hypothetical protein
LSGNEDPGQDTALGSTRVRVKVRGYEVDTQGHLNWAQYLHYAVLDV